MEGLVSEAGPTAAGNALPPFLLKPILQERIWGVERLPAFLNQPEAEHPIGEAWLTAEECLAEGAGFGGASLGELAERFPAQLGNEDGHGFPLLMKLLFPREKLSVQVHPNDVEAQALGMPRGKSECWYVLEAEPGAEVAVGLREALSAVQIEQAIADQTLEDKLHYQPVKAGDMVYVDAGTIHAIGPGMTVLETQQYSDTTYRLYDYGRPRPLHVKAGLAVSRAKTEAGLVAPAPMDGFTRLVQSPYFVVDRFDLVGGEEVALRKAGELQILVALGEGVVVLGPGDFALPLKPGHSAIVPAGTGEYRVRASAPLELIRIAQG